MAQALFKVDAKDLYAAGDDLIELGEQIDATARSVVFSNLQKGHRKIYANLSGRVLKAGSGDLRSLAGFEMTGGKNEISGRLGMIRDGPAKRYMRIHLTGGVITAKRAKNLAIPIGIMKKSSLRGKGPREIPGLFAIKSKKGNLLLVKRGKGKKELIPHFLLKPSVTIPRRDYLEGPFHDVQRSIRTDIQKSMKELRIRRRGQRAA